MGLFLSVNGWSQHVVPLVKQNPDKSILLMEGFDLRTVLGAALQPARTPAGQVAGLKSGS